MAGNIVLVCLFILVGIAGSSLTAEITKKAAVKTSDAKAKGGYVCPNNNGGQWINEPTGHFLYECTGSKIEFDSTLPTVLSVSLIYILVLKNSDLL